MQIFVRSASGVEIAPGGREVVGLARSVLREIDDLADDARRVTSGAVAGERRPIRFASMATTLRSALSAVERRLGDVTFLQSVIAPPADLNGLREGKFDVIYTIGSEYAPVEVGPPLRLATAVVEPVWLAVAPDHRLATEIGPVDLADLEGERWVTWPQGSMFHQLVVGACAKAGFAPRVECETADLWALAHMVSEGFVSIASPATIMPPNRPVALRGGPSLRLLLAWHESRVDEATVDALLAAVREWYFGAVRERNPAYWHAILSNPEDFPGHDRSGSSF